MDPTHDRRNMFRSIQSDPQLDDAIESVLFAMTGHAPDSKEYAAMTTQLKKLYKLKAEKPKQVSPDTWVLVGGNILAVLMIVGHERANVVTSKAFSLIKTLK
jgi:hypothetical protein